MRAFLNWSGGKDSALCLYKAKQQALSIEALVTAINSSTNRISMHGVKRILLEQQTASLHLPLYTVELPEKPGMTEYEQAVSETNQTLKAKGFTHVASGDLFLEDLKTYREQLYRKDEIDCLFPLWKRDTKELMQEFLSLRFRAIVVCVNGTVLDKSFCGRLIDEAFLNDLPKGVDICGENGEYHSFVFDGPLFAKPVAFKRGEIIYKEYPAPQNEKEECYTTPQPSTPFYFCDLLPCE